VTKSREEYLHKKSLILGRMFRMAYNSFGAGHPTTERLLESYKATRRELPGTPNDGVNPSTRLGAADAFRSTQ